MAVKEYETLKENAVGKTIEEAEQEAKTLGYKIRVRKNNGRVGIGTCEVNPNRINVEVNDGKITKVLGLG